MKFTILAFTFVGLALAGGNLPPGHSLNDNCNGNHLAPPAINPPLPTPYNNGGWSTKGKYAPHQGYGVPAGHNSNYNVANSGNF